MAQQDFDNAIAAFSITMSHVANWRDSYAGAVHVTRLRSAIHDARIACNRLEAILDKEHPRDGAAQPWPTPASFV
jgi:hypothetical protein